MKIVVVAAQKGGVAKTTTAVNLAVLGANQGLRVVLVDIDAEQGSASKWMEALGEDGDCVTYTRFTDSGDPAKLAALRQLDTDLVIIDTKAVLSDAEIDAVINIADFVIVPCQPSDLDIISITRTVQVKLVNTPHRVLITRVHPNTQNVGLQASLQRAGINTFTGVVRERAIWKSVIRRGHVATNLPKSAHKAATEYQVIAEQLFTELGLTGSQIDLRDPTKHAELVKEHN